MKTALTFAVVAALAYGLAAVLQAQVAHTIRESDPALSQARAFLRQPRYLLGLVLDLFAWAISRIALHTLPLFAVQTILAGSIAVTVLLARSMIGAAIRRADQLAILATIVGLVMVAASAGAETMRPPSTVVGWLILLGAPTTLLLGGVALRWSSPVVVAVICGLAFAGSALAARSVEVRGGLGHVLSQPDTWAVIGYSVVALVLHAAALRRGRVGAVTAAMWATEVVSAAIIGFTVLGDRVRPGLGPQAWVGISMTLVATIVLTRSVPHEPRVQDDVSG